MSEYETTPLAQAQCNAEHHTSKVKDYTVTVERHKNDAFGKFVFEFTIIQTHVKTNKIHVHGLFRLPVRLEVVAYLDTPIKELSEFIMSGFKEHFPDKKNY